MTEINLFMKILFVFIAIVFCAIPECSLAISNKRLCYDPDCSVPVSLAKTLINYAPNEPQLLPFTFNVDAKVYSKEAGSRTDLWGVEINGKHGYVPKRFLKEYKILHKNLKHEVPTGQVHKDSDKSEKNNEVQPKEQIIKPVIEKKAEDSGDLTSVEEVQKALNGITPTYEVIDGTTVHVEPLIQPTAVSETLETTAVPNGKGTVEPSPSVPSKKDESKPLKEKSVNKKSHDSVHGFNLKSFISGSEEITDLPEIIGVTTSIPSIETSTVDSETNAKTEVPSLIESGSVLTKETSTHSMNTVLNSTVELNGNSPENSESSEDTISSSSTDTPATSPDINDESLKQSNQTTDKPDSQEKPEEQISEAASIVDTVKVEEGIEAAESETEKKESGLKPVDNVEDKTDTQETKSKESVEKQVTDSDSTVTSWNETVTDHSASIEKSEENVAPTENEVETDEKTKTIFNVANETKLLEGATEKDNGNQIVSDIKPITASLIETLETVSANEDSENADNDETDDWLEDMADLEEEIEEELESSKSDVNDNPEEKVEAEIAIGTNVETVSSVTTESSENTEDKIQSALDKANTVIDPDLDIAEKSEPVSQEPVKNETVLNVEETAIKDVEGASNETDVNIDVNNRLIYESTIAEVPAESTKLSSNDNEKPALLSPEQLLPSSQESLISGDFSSFNEFRNRNLLDVESSGRSEIDNTMKDDAGHLEDKTLPEYEGTISHEVKVSDDNLSESKITEEKVPDSIYQEVQVTTPDVCTAESECTDSDNPHEHLYMQNEENIQNAESAITSRINIEHNYWLTLLYLSVTAATMLIFTLGYYYIENMRRDAQLIAKINKLEKDLLVSTKECTMLTDNLKVTKEKLTCIEDESFGSNEMVLSLKADLEISQAAKAELEDQIAMLEKDLETSTEAGLELEKMLREVLFSNNEVNPLAQSVEDLQARLNAQQATNESLTNALNLKTQENEALSAELASVKTKCEQLEVELTQVTANLKIEIESKRNIEEALADKIQRLEMQLKEISTEKATLQKELKGKEVEMKDLTDVINQLNSNNFDFDKLYEVSHIKAEANALLEERNELKVRLSEVEGAHNLLEEHVKLVKEEIATLSEQCKMAEKEKKEAETRLEVLSKFFKEKEAERQKEEAIWLQKQGEVMSTVERIHTMQNEIQNYKQQIEMLKREIVDQEREYKGQISALETKAHEQWVVARQMERRLEESKAEAGQLRNRLTLIEKNMNEVDPETKLHRLEANGETATSPPLFMGAESSSSPIMFSGTSGVPPPPPPSYMHSIFPPYLPPPLPTTPGVPPYEVGQRPPPLGGRLSSPPPMPLHPPSSRYENAGSPPPPISPHLLPPFNHHRSPPPPFGGEHIHPPPPPPPGSILPPPPGTTHPWGEDTLPPVRNSGFHPPQRKERVRNDKDYPQRQREQRVRNDKDSLRSSVESLDKTHNSM